MLSTRLSETVVPMDATVDVQEETEDDDDDDDEPQPLPAVVVQAPEQSTEWSPLEIRHLQVYVDWLRASSRNPRVPVKNTLANFTTYCRSHNPKTLKVLKKTKTWAQISRKVAEMRRNVKFILN